MALHVTVSISNLANVNMKRRAVESYRKFYRHFSVQIWARYTHFDSLKRVDDLRVYQGFMMPLNHQAGIVST